MFSTADTMASSVLNSTSSMTSSSSPEFLFWISHSRMSSSALKSPEAQRLLLMSMKIASGVTFIEDWHPVSVVHQSWQLPEVIFCHELEVINLDEADVELGAEVIHLGQVVHDLI